MIKFFEIHLDRSFQDLFIKYYGYESEIHNVTTEDGYMLTIFRCYSKSFCSENRKPVLLQHGMQNTRQIRY